MILVLFVAVAAVLGVSGWYVYQSSRGNTDTGLAALMSRVTGGGSATLSGTVTEGPVQPVCRINVPCEAPVANHELVADDQQGHQVASTKTDAQGDYTLHLSPGHYTLTLVPRIGLGVGTASVDVVGGANHYNLSVDTGLR